MVLNQDTITDPETYMIGTWTSPTLTNSLVAFPAGKTTEWGYLYWDETNVGEITDTDNQVRIDILKASDDSVLVADIYRNTDDTPSTLNLTSAALEDIKIQVKIYHLLASGTNPAVSGLRITYKNWANHQVFTGEGKNVMNNRIINNSPTYTHIGAMRVGGDQGSPLSTSITTSTFTALTTTIANPDYTGDPSFKLGDATEGKLGNYNVLGDAISSTMSYTPSEMTTFTPVINTSAFTSEFTALFYDADVPNGTSIQSIGLFNLDSSEILMCCGNILLTYDNTKKYLIKAKTRLMRGDSFLSTITNDGMNMYVDRLSKNLYLTDYPHVKQIVVGDNVTFTNTMTELDTENYGPVDFDYVVLNTSSHMVNFRMDMDKDTGNGFTYDANAILLESDETASTYDPQTVTNPTYAFDGDDTTGATKTATGSVFLGKEFGSSVSINAVRIKAKALARQTAAGTASAIIYFITYDGDSWSRHTELASVAEDYVASQVDLNVEVDTIVEVDSDVEGVGVEIVTAGDSAQEQTFYNIEYPCNQRRLLLASEYLTDFEKTTSYQLIQMAKVTLINTAGSDM